MKFSEFVGKEIGLNEAVSFSGNLNKAVIKENMIVLKKLDKLNTYLRKDWNNIKEAYYVYSFPGDAFVGIDVNVHMDKDMTKEEAQ